MKKIISAFCALMIMFCACNVNILATTSSQNKLVNYLNGMVGDSAKKNSCQAFVYQSLNKCLGVKNTKAACCATKAWQSYGVSTQRNNIPLGAAVYFGGSSVTDSVCKQKAGHVGLYVGNGYIIHIWSSKVKKTTIDYVIKCGYPYRGWGWQGGKDLSEGTSAIPQPTAKPTASTLKINITSYPTTINQGSSFGLRGNVSSNYKLTSVNGYILSSDGKTIIQGAYDKQNIYNVDIRTSVVNQKLLFNKLSPGSYIYKVTAWDESGANRVWSKPFTVKGKESTLKINITSAPTTIKKGSMFGLRGNVTSNYKLTSVNGYILSSDGKTIIQGAYDKQNIYNVDIRTSVVNQKLLFDKLSRGSYIFKVTAWDESGANKIWSKPFTVK